MLNFLLGYVAGAGTILIMLVIWCALVIAGRAGEINLIPRDDTAPEPAPAPVEDPELTKLRKQLAVCQDAARQQRERADNYYELFCEGARANAQLRNGGNHAA